MSPCGEIRILYDYLNAIATVPAVSIVSPTSLTPGHYFFAAEMALTEHSLAMVARRSRMSVDRMAGQALIGIRSVAPRLAARFDLHMDRVLAGLGEYFDYEQSLWMTRKLSKLLAIRQAYGERILKAIVVHRDAALSVRGDVTFTPWYPYPLRPVRAGRYIFDNDYLDAPIYADFDGMRFFPAYDDTPITYGQGDQWRGLAEAPAP